MSDFEDRLAALDPAAGQPYQHRDLDSLISRVTTEPAAAKRRLWQRLQVRIGGTLIAGALVTAGATAFFQGSGAALPVLAIQSTSSNGGHTPQRFGVAASGAMEIYVKYNFSGGPGLLGPTPTSPSYQLQLPSSAGDETSRLASIFGVAGTATNTGGGDWSVTSASGSALDYSNGTVPDWSYSAGPSTTSTNSSVSDLPSESTLASDVQRYLAKIGYDYSVSAPSFGTTTESDTSSGNSTSTEDVTYSVDVNGLSTDQSVSFSVDAHNDVVNASGPAFNVGSSLDYPLQSPSAGVSALNAQQNDKYPATSPTAGTSSSTPATPPIENVTLNSESITLETYQLTDGSTWLLPVYSYAGDGTGANGSSSTGTWYELAVDPSYVHGSAKTGVINY